VDRPIRLREPAVVPTEAEVERAAKERALQRVADLEALVAKLRDGR